MWRRDIVAVLCKDLILFTLSGGRLDVLCLVAQDILCKSAFAGNYGIRERVVFRSSGSMLI